MSIRFTKEWAHQWYLSLPKALLTWQSGKESTCQCWRYKRWGFDPWLRRIPWSRKWLSTPVLLPEKFHGKGAWRATVHGVSKSQTWLNTQHTHTRTHTHHYQECRETNTFTQLWWIYQLTQILDLNHSLRIESLLAQ